MVNDPRLVHRRLQQSRIENRFTLVSESLRDLLAHARAFQGQVLIRKSLLRQLEDVPLAAAETRRLCVVANLHRAKETRDQFAWEVVIFQILLGRKTDIAARAE